MGQSGDRLCPECGELLGPRDPCQDALWKALEAMPVALAEEYVGVRLMRSGLVGQLHAHHALLGDSEASR